MTDIRQALEAALSMEQIAIEHFYGTDVWPTEVRNAVLALVEKTHRAIAEYDALTVEVELLKQLVNHCWIHSGYQRCGYFQMDAELQALFDASHKPRR